MTNALEIRASKITEAFLENELGDYSHYEYEIIEVEDVGNKCYSVEFEVKEFERTHNGRFRITFDDNLEKFDQDYYEHGCTVEIQLYDDHYEKVETFEWTVKYFWMAILGNY